MNRPGDIPFLTGGVQLGLRIHGSGTTTVREWMNRPGGIPFLTGGVQLDLRIHGSGTTTVREWMRQV